MERKTVTGDLYRPEHREWAVVATAMAICKPYHDEVPRLYEPEEEFGFAAKDVTGDPVGTKTVELIEYSGDLFFERPVTDLDRLKNARSDRPFILTHPDGDEIGFTINEYVQFGVLGLDEFRNSEPGTGHIPDEAGFLVDANHLHTAFVAEAEVAAAVSAGRVSEGVPAHVADRYC